MSWFSENIGDPLSSFLMGQPGGKPIGEGRYLSQTQDLLKKLAESYPEALTSDYLKPYLTGETGAESTRMSDELKRMGMPDPTGARSQAFQSTLGGVSSDAATRFNIGMLPRQRRRASQRLSQYMAWLKSQQPAGYTQPTPGLNEAILSGVGMFFGGMYGGPVGALAGGAAGRSLGRAMSGDYPPIEY